jgi:uncharacterized membrane protein YbhN (UPF0104 family)
MKIKILVTLAVLVALLFVFYRVGINNIIQVFPKLLRFETLIIISLFYLAVLVRGIRWKYLLNENLSYLQAFKMYFINSFLDSVSPVVGPGEIWRIKSCRSFGLGKVTSVVIIERVMGGIAVFLFLLFLLSTIEIDGFQIIDKSLGIVFTILSAAIIIYLFQYPKFWKFIGRFIKVGDQEYSDVKELLQRRHLFLNTFLISALAWFIDLLSFWILANFISNLSFKFTSTVMLLSFIVGISLIDPVGITQLLTQISLLSLRTSLTNAGMIGIISITLGLSHLIVGYLLYTTYSPPKKLK